MSRWVNEWEKVKFYRLSKQTNEQVLFYARLKWRNGNDQTVENEEGVNDYYSAKNDSSKKIQIKFNIYIKLKF